MCIQALEDFEWKANLPFSLGELLELAPDGDTSVLEREHLLPTPAVRPPESSEDEGTSSMSAC